MRYFVRRYNTPYDGPYQLQSKALCYLLNILTHVCKPQERGCKLRERDCKRWITCKIH